MPIDDRNKVAKIKIAIVGLGYVGLPLAVEFAKQYPVVGFDTNDARIREIRAGKDHTLEADLDMLNSVLNGRPGASLYLTGDLEKISDATLYIITVPTPIDAFKSPDLKPLLQATEMVGSVLRKGDIVVYESTVYPGCTEEDCVPVLENVSGLRYNQDFFCGYSPERISPGDKVNTLTTIVKVTSGSTPEIADKIDVLYKSIIPAGTHKTSSIKVAEASKAIENAQRDVNISFVNELALIFDRMNIDTQDVLAAAATKWNFLHYKPGLVGGHCIGVDPYYLAHKAESLGYHPQVILSGRRVNDNMGMFIANKVIKLLIHKEHKIAGGRVLILGITFKENCPDIRNSRVIDIYNELMQFGMHVSVYDPYADPGDVKTNFGVTLLANPDGRYEAIVVAVGHDEFRSLNYATLKADPRAVIFDTKSILNREYTDARL